MEDTFSPDGLPLLLPDELALVMKLGEVATEFAQLTDRPSDQDRHEVTHEIHHLQQRIMARAAIRAFPLVFTPIGGFKPDEEEQE